MDEHLVHLSSSEVRSILDEDPMFWPGYEEWLDDLEATEEDMFDGEE